MHQTKLGTNHVFQQQNNHTAFPASTNTPKRFPRNTCLKKPIPAASILTRGIYVFWALQITSRTKHRIPIKFILCSGLCADVAQIFMCHGAVSKTFFTGTWAKHHDLRNGPKLVAWASKGMARTYKRTRTFQTSKRKGVSTIWHAPCGNWPAIPQPYPVESVFSHKAHGKAIHSHTFAMFFARNSASL